MRSSNILIDSEALRHYYGDVYGVHFNRPIKCQNQHSNGNGDDDCQTVCFWFTWSLKSTE